MVSQRLAIFIFVILCAVCSPVAAFEDTFQYYATGTFTTNDDWYAYAENSKHTNTIVLDGAATYSRSIRLRSDALYPTQGTGYIFNANSFSTNYIGFNVKDATVYRPNYAYTNAWIRIKFYDSSFVELMNHVILSNTGTATLGWYEYIRSGTQISLRIDGVDQGVIVYGATNPIAYVLFETEAFDNYVYGDPYAILEIDDVTTTGDIVGVCSESISHTVTETTSDLMNMSFSFNSFPFTDYTSSEYTLNIKRTENGTFTELQNETVKISGNSTIYTGFSNWNRSADFTDNDTTYGLYMVYLYNDDTSADTDYFFLVPPSDTSTIYFSASEIPIGSLETITYTIDGADFGSYNYHVRVYSQTAHIQSTAVTDAYGTVSWDTSNENAGIYYAVLSRTDKSTGDYDELNYDVTTLSENVYIHGYVYDAQEETTLANVSINFSQGIIWYNTTSNATGYYELEDITANVELDINALLENYTHENFSFTPLIAASYTMNLYLLNSTPTYSNTTIGGIVYDYPMHQAIPAATVNIYNSTWSNSTASSSITGFYMFEELANGTYTVNATKTNYQDSDEYEVDTNNGSWETQNILMHGLYDLTIRARDATTSGYITSFSVEHNDTISSTTNGSIIYSGLTYGLYTFSASASGYYSTSEDILVDETKTEIIDLSQTDSEYYSPHYVKFIVWGLSGYYSGVDVSVYEYGDSDTTYTGVTGNDGSVTFKLYETIRYTVTFISASQGVIRELTLYPVDNEYLIFISSADSWTEYDEPVDDVISIDVSTQIINSTAAYVNITYNDTLSETTSATVYLNQSDQSDAYNQTVIDSHGGYSNNWTHSFIVTDYQGESYYVHVIATHTTYGTIDQTYSVQFEDEVGVPGIPAQVWLYIAILIMMFTAGMFGAQTVAHGAMVLCIEGWVFLLFGWFDSIDYNSSIMTGLAFATVIAIIANINRYNRTEGHE